MMDKLNRRTFVATSLAGWALPWRPSSGDSTRSAKREGLNDNAPSIVDTNVNLMEWPFRHLKYARTKLLVEKLRHHRVRQAWAGTFEALFHKDISGVNARLAEECSNHGEGMLLPFGTVNPAWPGWEEDLRRCHEVYRMPGIRLYPAYQAFELHQPEFFELVERAAARALIIQIVGDMEDVRTHHPVLNVRDVNIDPLFDVLKKFPAAKVQLLYWNHRLDGKKLDRFISGTNVVLDISRIESTGGVGRLIDGNLWQGFGSAHPVPVERLLFGSHAPYFPVETNLLKLFESPLSIEQLSAIMSDNAERLLNKP